jgi:formiminotetrahydrofolate cyclodeaminase
MQTDQEVTMRNDTIDSFPRALAARVPAPGGGATAALHAAQAAALVAMVACYSDGPRYAEHAEEITQVRDTADVLRERALDLAERDVEAFTAVTDAYRLPKGTEGEAEQRSRAIAEAVLGASRPPADVVTTAGSVLDLAERLLPLGNRNVVSDVAAAAEAARAAATTARVNIDINLGGILDADAHDELREACQLVDELAARAEKVTAAVRAELA